MCSYKVLFNILFRIKFIYLVRSGIIIGFFRRVSVSFSNLVNFFWSISRFKREF